MTRNLTKITRHSHSHLHFQFEPDFHDLVRAFVPILIIKYFKYAFHLLNWSTSKVGRRFQKILMIDPQCVDNFFTTIFMRCEMLLGKFFTLLLGGSPTRPEKQYLGVMCEYHKKQLKFSDVWDIK